MNKTRMGKRAASLLLSLVMMLSLLPTAAYAAMADGVDTQGAIVSGNGTDVSDDSNSSGGTGDLQVEDSENSGNTGDQQVGGSSGSGTADDTAGAEGGADTTGAEGGNDSTSVTPSNRVEVNGTVYATLDEAIAAAEPVNGVITYEIYGKVEANSTESWIEVLKAGLTDVTKVAFVGMTNDAEISITNSTSVLADQNYDIDVSFVDLTLSHSNGAWVGDLGHATEYFTCVLRNTDAANNTVTYTNCTFPNGACNNQYGKTVFDTCEFTNTTSGKYNLWNYGGTTEITNSAFTGTRGIKTYNEGTLAESPEVAIKDTTFTGLTEKAAIVASKPTDSKLDSISATECTKGVFQKDIEGSADAEKVTIEANGSGISGNFNVTAEKTAEAAKDEFNITAGSFTAEVPGDYCAEGFTIEKKTDGSYGVKENQPSANVAKVGDTEYATLDKAIAALSGSSYTLELLDESAWDVATPVYWAAGSQSGYAATLADALTAAYKANGDITIVCRPGTDVGKLTHGHVADNITIYGNNAYISSGECDLEVDTYMFSRDTGKQVTTGGAYLDKDITVTAYELDNLGVWGQRHTDHKVTVNLTDCDSVNGITVQRVYISGTTGVNDITLTGCDFGTRATSVYSNADGKVVIDNCSFTGAQVPVNFNHKANGTQAVTVQNSKFTNCGDNGDWKQFAAPVRFVNSGSGTMTTSVDTCTFTGTVGGNGDILLGDGRVGEKSNDVKLTVENTAANVRAQQPGYYAKDGTTDTSKLGTKDVTASDTLTTSVTQLMPSSETTYVAEVKGVKYKSLQAAIDKAGRNATVRLLADVAEDVVISKSIALDLGGKTLTNTNAGKATISVQSGTVTVKNGNVKGGTGYYNIEAKKDANLTLTDVAATAGNTGSSMIDNWGTLTITSGTYTGGLNVVKSEEGSVLNISGGTFTRETAPRWGITGTVLVYGTTTITGGTFNEKSTSTNARVVVTGRVDGYDSITYVKGGTFNGNGNNVFHHLSPAQADDSFEVSGGTFNKSIPDYYCADGFIPTKNAGGTYGVKEGQYVAKVGSKKYETLADAIRLAAKGKTITLLADVEQNTQLTINKSITLDLNGKTIKNTVDIWGDKANAILSITNGAKVTITGNGTIDAKENDCYTINVVKGDLTIENGTFYGNVSVVQVEEGTLSIKGGTFDLHQKWEGSSKYLFNCIDKAYVDGSANVAISGGTFVGFDPNVSPEQKVDGKTPSFAAPGVGITKNENGSFTAVDGMTAQILDKDGNSVKAYRTLAEAVAAAEDGQTVRLLADVEQNAQLTIEKSITLDLNGKTIKISGYTAEKAQVSVKGNLTIQDSSEAQTGKICSDYTGTAGRVVSVENGGKLTIAGGTITTEGMSGLSGSAVYIASGAEVNMTGGAVKVDAKPGNVAMNVKGSTGVFTMSGGSVIAEAGDGTETYITAISGSSGSTIQISAGTVSGPQALFARSSATTITGGSFTGSITVKNGSISGGTFDRALDKKACAAGYVPADNGDGTYGVEVGKFTVKVTSRTTGSDSPVANVAGGGSDITYAEGITVTASAISGYNFVGWFVNEYTGTPYSTDLTCKVKPTDDWTMIAVYEPISGGKFWLTVTASEFTVNGGAVQDSYLYEQFAIGASVTVNFTGSENFLYWVNASNKVVSTEKSYTFIMGSETTLKAVYGKARQNQATVVFISHSDQIISSKAYTTNDTIQFPVPPIKMGCTFTGWSMTEADIRAAMANNSGIIQVRALYTEPSIACKVTVVYPEGTDNQVVNAVVGKAIDVTAKDIEGKTFSYWTDNAGNILGYTKTLKLAPSGDMTVKAVYDQAAEAKPVITMSEVSATTANESYVVTFMATRAVPNGYKVVKQGILWSRDAVCGEDGAAAYMQFDSNGKLPDGVRAYIGNNLDLNGVTRYDIITKYNDRTFYGRGYMVLESDAGKLLYIYTDTIASGSYDSLTK